MGEIYRNRAFISYSQTDKIEARRIQRWLEAFKAPKKLSSKRIGRVFRDETDLSSAADLGEALQREIDGSQALIVLCSPRAARSEWVEREVRHFRATGRSDQIFALILDGIPNSDDPASECFPPSFRVQSGEDLEPLAVNLAADGRDRAMTRLAAGLLGARFDDLWQRERRRRRARMTFAGGIFATGLGLLAVAGVAGWFAVAGTANVARATSDLFAREAETIFSREQGVHLTSLLMALHGDPAAQASIITMTYNGAAGYPASRAVLTRAYVENRLLEVVGGGDNGGLFGPSKKVIISSDGSRSASFADWGDDTALVRKIGGVTNPLELPWSGDCITAQCLAFFPDGTMLATRSQRGAVRVVETESGKTLQEIQTELPAPDVLAVSRDGLRLAVGHINGTVQVWDWKSGEIVAEIAGGPSRVLAVALSPDGHRIVCAFGDGTTGIWNIGDQEAPALLLNQQNRDAAVWTIAYSSDGTKLAIGSEDQSIRILNPNSGEVVTTLIGHEGLVSSIAFSPDAEHLASGSWDGTARLWNVDAGNAIMVFPTNTEAITSVAFSSTGAELFTGSADGAVRRWRVQSGDIQSVLEGHTGMVNSVVLSSGASVVLSASNDDTVRAWDLRTGVSRVLLEGALDDELTSGFSSVAISPDGLVFAVGAIDGGVWLGDIASDTPPRRLGVQDSFVHSVAFSPDGMRLASAAELSLMIWDAPTGALRSELTADGGGPGVEITSVAFSPDGALIAAARSDFRLSLFDLKSGEVTETAPAHDARVTSVSFTSDGKHLVSGSQDNNVIVWDLQTREVVATLEHPESVRSLAAFPEGALLATGGADDVARIFDLKTGKELARFEGHAHDIQSISVAPDGQHIATGSWDRTVRVWNVSPFVLADPLEQVRMACELLQRLNAPLSFSKEDVRTYPVLAELELDPETGDPISPCLASLPPSAFEQFEKSE